MSERALAILDALFEGLVVLLLGAVLLLRWRRFTRSKEQAHELLCGDAVELDSICEGPGASREALAFTVAGVCFAFGALSVVRYLAS